MDLWSIEKDDRCPTCGGVPILVTPGYWTDTDDQPIEDTAEVSAHYCCTCERLVSLMLRPRAEGSERDAIPYQ